MPAVNRTDRPLATEVLKSVLVTHHLVEVIPNAIIVPPAVQKEEENPEAVRG